MEEGSDVLIIGGGIHGLSAALHLAARGVLVRLLEKDYIARHASGVNAGGVRTLGRHPAELPISLRAKRLWLTCADWLDKDCGFSPVGQIRVAENAGELDRLRIRSAAVDAMGLDYQERVIDQRELRERLPALAPHCVGGLIVEDDGYANPYRTTLALKRAALRVGVMLHENCKAVQFHHGNGGWSVMTSDGRRFRADVLFNCAGAWGHRVAAATGEKIALNPNGSMLMITARLPPIVGPVVGAAGRSLSFKQFPNGTVLVGGGYRATVDIDRNLACINLPGLTKAARTAVALFPFIAEAQAVRFWSGIEGFMPDGLPVIGPSLTQEKLFHAFGFSAHGFQLGFAVGEILADLATQTATGIAIDAFSVGRPTGSKSA